MKCLKCNTNSLYRARSGGKCPNCQKEFVFEPKRGDLFTDTFFDAALNKVSHKQSIYFHPRQLYFEIARRRYNKLFKNASPIGSAIGTFALCMFFGIFLGFISFSLFDGGPLFFLAMGLYLCFSAWMAARSWKKALSPQIRLDWMVFLKHLQRWKKVQGSQVPMLLAEQSATKQITKNKVPAEDLFDYNVERAIICDKPEIVDFLLANHFHIEQKCAILSFNGYPHERFAEIKAMLQRSSQLMVYVIHNASTNGSLIAAELKRPEWFPQAQIFDLGLSPKQAQKFHGFLEPANSSAIQISGFSEADQAWLAQWKLDLMVLPPASLLKHLRAQINRHQQLISDAYARNDDADLDVAVMLALEFESDGADDFG
jgi:hypothetical protein